MIRTYTNLSKINEFYDRLNYLKLFAQPGAETFGGLRHINQAFYRSREWRSVRNFIISRDGGCDLGIFDRGFLGKVFVHHMNPISLEILEFDIELALNPEYLITTSEQTHLEIHFGPHQRMAEVDRYSGDTTLW